MPATKGEQSFDGFLINVAAKQWEIALAAFFTLSGLHVQKAIRFGFVKGCGTVERKPRNFNVNTVEEYQNKVQAQLKNCNME